MFPLELVQVASIRCKPDPQELAFVVQGHKDRYVMMVRAILLRSTFASLAPRSGSLKRLPPSCVRWQMASWTMAQG